MCIIGGSRYFGRRLIENLRDAGTAVTVVNRGSAPAPEGVTHLRADRNDEDSLRRVLDDRHFDAVIDQVCYTPVQAAVALRVFADRTRRYVMTSTVEVYAGLDDPPHAEHVVDPKAWPVRTDRPWDDPALYTGSPTAAHSCRTSRVPCEAALTGPVKSARAAQARNRAISRSWMNDAGRGSSCTITGRPARILRT
ncbi:NAD-dependent epimerase/dehydratase family protein [Microbispora catharanthi]|uniref:NAD-dependent epimerase/dehydratase family protein n=1 Tax=Microbispora catharanthi TaxID=1712871 RepID=UPI001F0DA267|nr:NAD-dependent epimerase/dehydratase family protein [Microbispora catharanthi]